MEVRIKGDFGRLIKHKLLGAAIIVFVASVTVILAFVGRYMCVRGAPCRYPTTAAGDVVATHAVMGALTFALLVGIAFVAGAILERSVYWMRRLAEFYNVDVSVSWDQDPGRGEPERVIIDESDGGPELETPDSDAKYVCEECGAEFDSGPALGGHISRGCAGKPEEDGPEFVCPFCGDVFRNGKYALNHVDKNHKEEKEAADWVCECGYEGDSLKGLGSHLNRAEHHSVSGTGAALRFGTVKKKVSTRRETDKAITTGVVCGDCGQSYADREALEAHRRERHG